MSTDVQKDESIRRMIDRLKCRLGVDVFDVVDSWDADMYAIGIARRDNHHVLAYVCTYGKPADNFFVSLELPPEFHTDLPYRKAGDFEVRSFDELVEIIRKHFSTP